MKHANRRVFAWTMTAMAAIFGPSLAVAASLRVAGGVGVIFAPLHIMKQASLLEARAKQAGQDLSLEMISFPSGSAVTDALLSGNVDIIAVGLSNTLLLWSRTRENVKAIAAVSGTKSVLVTRDPEVKSLKDYKPTNRISVTSLKIANQAVYLQMALDKTYGDPTRFDPMMVQLGFTDAAQAMVIPRGPIDSMFAGPPYYQELLKRPEIHPVTSTLDISGPATNLMAATTVAFHRQRSADVKTFIAALSDAQAIIRDDPRRAAELYLKSTGEKFSPDELAAIFKEDGNIFQVLPLGTQEMAAFMGKSGMIAKAPTTWKDWFFDDLLTAPGVERAN